MKEGRNLQIIEWGDLNKRTFYTYSLCMAGALRLTIYPMNLVKTRLQAQEGRSAYRGLWDAFKQIARKEGIRGFYKGFPVSLVQVFSGQLYLTTYEKSKQTLFKNQTIFLQHLLGGFVASTVSQSIMVPVDIIAQHQQVMGAEHKMTSVDLSKNSNLAKATSSSGQATRPRIHLVGQSVRISRHILQSEGLRGLYRGYFVSLSTYGSNSALYWAFYYLYSELVEEFLPKSDNLFREQFRILSAGLFSAVTAVLLTNPLDVVRTRFQLQVGANSAQVSSYKIFKSLLFTEGLSGFSRGLSARIVQSAISSCVIVLGYEYIKKASLLKNDETDDFLKRKLREHSRYGDIDDVNMVAGITTK